MCIAKTHNFFTLPQLGISLHNRKLHFSLSLILCIVIYHLEWEFFAITKTWNFLILLMLVVSLHLQNKAYLYFSRVGYYLHHQSPQLNMSLCCQEWVFLYIATTGHMLYIIRTGNFSVSLQLATSLHHHNSTFLCITTILHFCVSPQPGISLHQYTYTKLYIAKTGYFITSQKLGILLYHQFWAYLFRTKTCHFLTLTQLGIS